MNGVAPEPVWERAWSLEEIRSGSQSWSLAADAGLLHFLQEFSQQTISRTHEIKKQVDGLIRETKATDCRLHNVFNDFLMLSNTQFIENRVYDEEVEEPIPKTEGGDKQEQEKTREQKEADLIPKIQEAVNYGLQVLDSAFEQLDIKAGNSDSEEEEANERVELILEPKDLYIDRPLPYLIGSKLFMDQDDVGLGDISSEEGSVDSDRGSVIDSEHKDEEESDDEFGNASEDDQKTRTALMSDEDDDDLFGDSEKEEEEEEDLEENARLRKKRPTSFADELAARIKGDLPSIQDEQSSLSSAEIKAKKPVEEKKEARVSSDDEDDDIFKPRPPKLTDEDFSPFGSKGGLFSGGTGLFDDDGMSDLFAVAPKGEETIEKEVRVPINDEPSSKAVRKVPAGAVSLFPGANEVFSPSLLVEKETKKPVEKSMEKVPKQPGKVSLFDDDDDDNFFVVSNNKRSNPAIVKSAAELFDCDDEGDLFKEKHEVSPAAVSNASKEAKRHNETLVGKKSQPSSAEDLKPATPTLPKSLKGLFSDEEDSEDLFAAPAEKQQSKPPQEKAKQLDTLKKASSSLFSSDEEEHWHTAKQNKPISKDGQKGEAVKPASVISQPATRPSLFEDGQEEDLFAITTDSQRKHPKAALLFEEDAINGGSLFGPQPSFLPSVTQAAVEKSQAPPSLFAEEENLLETPTRRQMEDKAGHTEQLGAVPASVSEGGDSTEQQEKAKLEPFTVPALGPTSNSNMFATSPPLLDKEARSRGKNVLSLFEEEEEEKMEDQSVIKNVQKEMGKTIEKSASSKSTGVFQDEELLFSHKLQKDNDPDVDLFASTKKPGPAKHDVKLPSGEGLFGDDDDDYDLFSTAKAKPPKVAEKKIVVKKDSAVPFLESNKVRESNQRVKQDGVKLEATEKSTGPAPIKSKEPSSRIGKLQANLAINPAALLPPSAIPKLSSVKSVLPGLETQPDDPDGTRCTDATSAAGNNQESGVSFDCPMQADTLQSANKSRIKVTGKRRPPTRTARRLATQESSENEEMTITEEPPRLSSKQSFVLPNAQQPCEREPECVENAKLPLRSDSGTPSPKAGRCPPAKPMDLKVGNDLFGSDDLFVNSLVSKPAPAAKAKEGGLETLAGKAPKSGEKKPALTVLDESGGEDIFSAIKQKPSKKASPISFLENEEDLFTSKKPTKKKELKPALQPEPDQKAQDIFEDDIFATEAIKPPTKAKEKVPETNLFDDNVDIFADLMVKPKEKAKKKVEPKSIFDDDMDDIFSSSSQPKTSALKCRSPQTASEATKSEIKASSTFDDPLNAFGGQ